MLKKIRPILFFITAFYGVSHQVHAMDDHEKHTTGRSLADTADGSIVGRSIRKTVAVKPNATYSLTKDEQVLECETIPTAEFSEDDYRIFYLNFYYHASSKQTFEQFKDKINSPFAHAKLMTKEGSQIVGAIHYWPEEKEAKTYINIFIATHPDFQKRGVATALINHVITQTQSHYDGMQVHSQGRALDFYRALGFVQGAPVWKNLTGGGPSTSFENHEFTKEYLKNGESNLCLKK